MSDCSSRQKRSIQPSDLTHTHQIGNYSASPEWIISHFQYCRTYHSVKRPRVAVEMSLDEARWIVFVWVLTLSGRQELSRGIPLVSLRHIADVCLRAAKIQNLSTFVYFAVCLTFLLSFHFIALSRDSLCWWRSFSWVGLHGFSLMSFSHFYRPVRSFIPTHPCTVCTALLLGRL